MKKTINRVLLALAILVGFTLIASPAQAATWWPAAAVVAVAPEIVFALDLPQLLNLLIAVVFPVLVGLVTTKVTQSWLKAVLLASISLASGVITALLEATLSGVPFDLVSAVLTGLAAWIIAIATHLGFWRPSGITDRVQAIGARPKHY